MRLRTVCGKKEKMFNKIKKEKEKEKIAKTVCSARRCFFRDEDLFFDFVPYVQRCYIKKIRVIFFCHICTNKHTCICIKHKFVSKFVLKKTLLSYNCRMVFDNFRLKTIELYDKICLHIKKQRTR